MKTWWNDDGTFSIKAKLPPAEGRLGMAAIERAMDAAFRAEHRTRGTIGYCVDGFGDLEDVPTMPANDPGGPRDVTECPDDVPTGTPARPRDPDPAALPDDVPAGTPGADMAAESPPPRQEWAARQADALVAIAETIVASGLRPGSGPRVIAWVC